MDLVNIFNYQTHYKLRNVTSPIF